MGPVPPTARRAPRHVSRRIAGAQRRIRLTQPVRRRRWRRWAGAVRRFLLNFFSWNGWSKVASLATAVAAIAALWFSGQALRSTRAQYGLSEQGEVTDRFAKAVENLGSEKPDVRMGGIYSLERLSRDSTADRPTIMDVLS